MSQSSGASSSSKTGIIEDAQFINEKQYLKLFRTCLNDNLGDIRVVEYEQFKEDCIAEWARLICRNCGINFNTSKKLLDHILQCEFTAEDALAYYEHKIISKGVQDVLKEAQNKRAESSFLVKTIADDKKLKLVIPFTSPLATFMIRGMTIYSEKWPKNNIRVIPTEIIKGGKVHVLFFTAREIARKYENFARRKRTEEMTKTMEIIDFPRVPDIVLEPTMRKEEETRELAKALGFAQNVQVSQEEILKEMEKRFGVVKIDPINEDKGMEEQKTPRKTLLEKRKLHIAFTPGSIDPTSPKRQTITPKKIDL